MPRLLLHQAHYELLTFARNRQARMGTLLMPLILLLVLVSAFGDNLVGPGHVRAATLYVPGLMALAVIASSFVNLVISVVNQRETGVLKRRRATPVPAWALIGGRALAAATVSVATTAVLVVVARAAFDVGLPGRAIPWLALTVLVGAAAFCSLAYAMSTAIRSADGAQPTIQAVMLPLYLASGIFIPNPDLPSWVHDLASAFPVERLADGLHAIYRGRVVWGDLAVLAAWASAGLLVALRRFRWDPAR